MRELERISREAHEQLGEPSAGWLRAQRNQLRRAFSPPVRPQPAYRRWALGAALVLTAAVCVVVWLVAPKSAQLRLSAGEMVLNAPNGDRRVALADGSSLSLSALSLARVSAAADSTRCVVEAGNVRFDVAPQKGRPFTVVAGAFEIRVVGTRFSVSRDSAGLVEVRVDHGVVRVQAPNRNAPIELEAGDRLRADDSGISLTHPTPSSAVATAPSPPPSLDPQPLGPGAPKTSASAPRSDWRTLYRERKYAAALASARQLGVDQLLDSLDTQALSDLADTARLAGDSDLALRSFASVERRFPGTPHARDALFLSGRIHATRGQADAARTRFEKYLALNPHGTYSIEATGRLVELYAAAGDSRARNAAKTYLELAPDGPYQRLCRSVLSVP